MAVVAYPFYDGLLVPVGVVCRRVEQEVYEYAVVREHEEVFAVFAGDFGNVHHYSFPADYFLDVSDRSPAAFRISDFLLYFLFGSDSDAFEFSEDGVPLPYQAVRRICGVVISEGVQRRQYLRSGPVGGGKDGYCKYCIYNIYYIYFMFHFSYLIE